MRPENRPEPAATGAPGIDDETGVRGRSKLGLTLSGSSGAAVPGAAFYDSIGDEDFEAWGGQLRID